MIRQMIYGIQNFNTFSLTWFCERAFGSFFVGVLYGELWNIFDLGDSWPDITDVPALGGGVIIDDVITDSLCWFLGRWLLITDCCVLKNKKIVF